MTLSPRKLELMKDWPKGCNPPRFYTAWHEWAEAQHFHGIEQTRCKRCELWRFPQELNADGECHLHSRGESV